ncbi:CPBP family glutamic-type intramembrane protease [Glutamicibacter uratoxydans]|uniref:CPBP family glutamic-type intramembrane protease n=1 Tax=Glutamicibacter uratoxydans TaxID=43667 RepID=UPI003D6FD8E2
MRLKFKQWENTTTDTVMLGFVELFRINRIPTKPDWSGSLWRTVMILIVIGTLIASGWGSSTIRAMKVLFAGERPAPFIDASKVELYAASVRDDVLLTVLAVGVFLIFRGPERARPKLSISVKAYFVYPLLVTLGTLTQRLFAWIPGFDVTIRGEPYLEPGVPQTLYIADAALAGPTEELVLMAILVVAGRRLGYSWAMILLAAVIVRVPFHLYYGWAALGLSVWAVLVVLLYRRTNALLPLVLGHTTWNVMVDLELGIVLGLFSAAGLVIAGLSLHRCGKTVVESRQVGS